MSGERELRKRLAALERRVATLIMVGTAEANQGGKTKVRFDDAGAGGSAFSSAYLPQAASAGKNGQGVSSFTKIGTGEPVFVINPGGEMGEHSRVMPAGHVGDHPSPGTAEADGQVIAIGNSKVEIRDGLVRLTCGGSSIVLTDGSITVKTPAFRGEKG